MKITAIVFCAILMGRLFAQAPVQAASAPISKVDPAQQPTIVEQIKKSVLLIETDCYVVRPDGTLELGQDGQPLLMSYAGTAFVVSMPDSRLPPNSGFTYLVTNRHVAAPGVEDGKPCKVAQYIVRGDRRVPDATGAYITVNRVPSTAFRWIFPSDESVDLAIVPFAADWQNVDLIALPTTLFMTDAEKVSNRVEEGDSVMFAGVFAQMIGQTHSEPIVRQGKIAMMPREPMPTTLRKLGDVYLVDCHVFGGNSGSPMFVDLAGQRYNGLTAGFNYRLLGVVSGYVTEGAKFELQTVASYAGTVAANSGVAMVVPSQKLLDLLGDSALKSLRDSAVSSLPKQ